MTRYMQLGIHGTLYAVVDGTHDPVKPIWDATNKWNTPIAGVGTYFFPLGGERYGAGVETIHHSLSLVFPASLAGTFTIEGTNCPKTQSGVDIGGPDVSDFDTSDAWQKIDITQSGMLYANVTGTNNSLTKLTATLGGTNAGGVLYNLPDLGMLRLRGRLIVTSVAASWIRIAANAKLGS